MKYFAPLLVASFGGLSACTDFDSQTATPTTIKAFYDATDDHAGASHRVNGGKRHDDNTNNVVLVDVLLRPGIDLDDNPADLAASDTRILRAPVASANFNGTAYVASPITATADRPAYVVAYADDDLREGSFMLAYDPTNIPVPRSTLGGAQFTGDYLGHIIGKDHNQNPINVSVSGDIKLRLNAAGNGIERGVFMTNRAVAGAPAVSLEGVASGYAGDLYTTGGRINSDNAFLDLEIIRFGQNAPINPLAITTEGNLSGAITAYQPNGNLQSQVVGGILMETEVVDGTDVNNDNKDGFGPAGSCTTPQPPFGLNGCTVEVGVFAASKN